jgi:SpoVK/Ycf46/Vps4 family AAA+-type ATPase
MRLLAEYRDSLDLRDIKGLTEQVRNSRTVEVGEFRRQLDNLVGDRRRDSIEALLEDRRDLLEEDELREVEEELDRDEPDLQWVEEYLEERTYERKLKQTVRRACDGLDLPRRLRGKVRRKVTRRMKRAGELPTLDSARSRVKATLPEAERQVRLQEEMVGRLEEPKIEDFDSLVIEEMPYDFFDVAGMEALKDRLEASVEFCLNPEKERQYRELTGHRPGVAGLLMYGAPGTGKTHMARCAAGELAAKYDLTIINAPVKAIFGQHWSKWLESVAHIFNLAKRNNPSVVIWDEFDGIGWSPRFGASKHHGKVMNELKSQFSGVAAGSEVSVHIATTNNPYYLDPPLIRPGRLGEHIHVLPPDFTARREAIESHLERGRLADDVDFDRLAELTAGMTMAEIERVMRETADAVGREDLGPHQRISMEDVTHTIEQYPPRDFRAWLEGVREKLDQSRYKEPRALLSELYEEDIPRFLDNNELP